MSVLTVGSLFAGIGGFDLAAERAGFKVKWQVEIDPFCRKVLEKHWPHVRRYDDVRTVGSELERVDIICGGFPCQDISVAGRGAGIGGTRSGLWSEYARLIRELRPRYVVVENVSALLTRGMGRVLGDLAESGYDAEWDCIPASAVGAPHQRDRVWLVAYAKRGGRWPERQRGGLARVCGDWPNDTGATPQSSAGMGDTNSARLEGRQRESLRERAGERTPGTGGASMADAEGGRAVRWDRRQEHDRIALRSDGRGGAFDGFGEWWKFEPDVGGSPDGLPTWLDRCIGRGMSYVESLGAVEALRQLWNPTASQTLRRAIGGLDRIQQAEMLFLVVRQYAAGSHEAWLLMEGEEVPEAYLRSLRNHALSAGASRRPGQVQQHGGEHPDAVQVLPRLLALDGPPYWAGGGWEDAVPRVANSVPRRMDRLRGLGNAIVPQVAQWIFEQIKAAEAMSMTAE